MFKKMKAIAITVCLLFEGFFVSAQEKLDQWPALKDFHAVISTTFHPSEDGNLVPIKTRSGELLEKATALAKSPVPATINDPSIPAITKELLEKVTKLDAGIRKKKLSDKAITAQLIGVHDTYHRIVEKCVKGKE